jgi:hypothetical protein
MAARWMMICSCTLLALLCLPPRLYSAPEPPPPGVFHTEVPAHAVDIILARPTRDAVTVSVLAYADTNGYIAYGTEPGKLTRQTPPRTFPTGQPVEVVLTGLKADTPYYYQLRAGNTALAEGAFHTARPAGSPFTFTITADPHLDERTVPALYLQTLANARADKPDFHLDLGDTFMTEKHKDRDSAAAQYLAQRYYFAQTGTPLFLTLGNHDGETAREQDGTAGSTAVWSATMRKRYFPCPVPDVFYTGNATKHPLAGELQDYYAWTWGDALFIVLDPFWYTPRQRRDEDNWVRTLGKAQYDWLTTTLEKSTAKYTFVFIHHLVGGLDKDARGGTEAATLYEWGGKNADGSDGFAAHRPGWALPIHQLLVKHHVTAVFHGHDHFYDKQELDGIIYQEVPQPGWEGRFDAQRIAEYGYRSGNILGSSGHLRVTVTPRGATVDYVSAKDRTVAASYVIAP